MRRMGMGNGRMGMGNGRQHIEYHQPGIPPFLSLIFAYMVRAWPIQLHCSAVLFRHYVVCAACRPVYQDFTGDLMGTYYTTARTEAKLLAIL